MGKPTKRNSKKKYNYDIDRRRLWKKRKRLTKINCKEIAEAWDDKKGVSRNLEEMGLSSDPNKTIKIKKTKELLTPLDADLSTTRNQERKKGPSKQYVVEALEEEANLPPAKKFRLPSSEVQFVTYMMDKYGDDYKAMAKDPTNYYQSTPKQIKRKIAVFKSIPEQYEKYLKSKVDDIMKPWRLKCCTPEPTELRGLPLYNLSIRKQRRVTRKYEAARRNGHYSNSPAVTDGNTTVKLPVCLSRVRRKLKFGRKPPRKRSNLEDENFDKDVDEVKQNKSNSQHNSPCNCFDDEIAHLTDTECAEKPVSVSSLSRRKRTRLTPLVV